jgi:hypothetical protein
LVGWLVGRQFLNAFHKLLLLTVDWLFTVVSRYVALSDDGPG